MALNRMPERGEPVEVHLDRDEDVLYISLGSPVASHVDEKPGGILLRWADADNQPTGVTALHFLGHWRDRLPEFSSLVADHLNVSDKLIEAAVRRVM